MSGFSRLTITFGGRVCISTRKNELSLGELEKPHEIGSRVTDEHPIKEVTLVFTKKESVLAMIGQLERVMKNMETQK